MCKKYISLILCLGLIISLCSCTSEKSKWDSNTGLNILIFDGTSPLNPAGALEKYNLWETEFNSTFDENVNLEAKLIKPWDFGEIGERDFETEVQDFTSGGIILMPTSTYDTLFKDRKEYFEPLDKYLVNSDLHTLWPESLIEFGSFPGDGKTWCLPTRYSSVVMLRAYNKSALIDMGIAAPTTIEDFESALGQYYLDYGNPPILINPESIDSMYQSTAFAQFADIFALGGIKNIDTIVYDYTTKQFRNIMDLKNTEAILNMLKDLFFAGIIGIDKTFSSNMYSTLLSDGDLFTALVHGPVIMVNDKIEYSNIDYENSSVAYVLRDQVSHVAVILKGTKNTDEVLEKFIDTFLVSGEKYVAASRGFEGIHYEYKEGILVPKKAPQYQLGTISQFSDYDIDQYVVDKERDVYKEYKEVYMANQHIIDPYYLSYFLNRNVFESRTQETEIQELFSNIMIKLFKEDSNVQGLINEYRNLCFEKGVDDYIDEANFQLNLILKDSINE